MKEEYYMGYRSEVAYLIMFNEQEVYNQFKVQYKLDDKFTRCWEDEHDNLHASVRLEFDDEKCRVKFEAHDVKWYDTYDDVMCHHELLKLADEYHEKYNCVDWTFVRIGEEDGDVERQFGGIGDASMYLYPVSSIQWSE
jgi:hypothetical protein